MVKDKQNTPQDEGLMEVEQALTSTEQFIEKNQRVLTIAVGAVVAIVAIYMGYKKFYMNPLEKEAQEQMYVAEQYFEKDSFNLALNGDGNYLGFLDIVEEYGSTKSANLANYYAGVSYLHMGKYQDAIDYLNSFSTDDLNLSIVAKGAKGDAYLELGKKNEAMSLYKEAAAVKNEFTAPIYLMKLGNLYEDMKQFPKAVEVYNQIKADYPNSNEGRTIEKFIARASKK
ncbi:tetratricopeptide repeat protein [Prolixibacteraceae bacterium JC049]|nr:tetratricopeptide repeat protein [Prolixibacteraceae bacterium JC049]